MQEINTRFSEVLVNTNTEPEKCKSNPFPIEILQGLDVEIVSSKTNLEIRDKLGIVYQIDRYGKVFHNRQYVKLSALSEEIR